ncbi:unnamed protein product [Caenorhabditis brenneri]
MRKLPPSKYYMGGQKYDLAEFLGKGPDEWKKLLPTIKTCDLSNMVKRVKGTIDLLVMLSMALRNCACPLPAQANVHPPSIFSSSVYGPCTRSDFAFKSPEFRSFLKQNKTPLKYLKWELEKKFMGLRLKLPAFKSVSIGYIPSNRCFQKGEDEPFDISEIEFEIDNYDLEILQTRKTRSTSPFQVLKTITDVIMDIFIVEDTGLSWYMPSIKGFMDLFVWDHSRHFKKFKFDSADPDLSDALKFLLEEVSTQALDIINRESTIQYSFPFKSTCLDLDDYSDSFKMDSFLKMECKDVELTVGKISSSELNALLKCWINGGLVNLEFLEVSLRRAPGWRDYLFNEEEVFEGIQVVRSSGPLPPRPSYVLKSPRYIRPSVDYDWEHNIFEIFRKSDNRKATVGMNPRTFGIAVWPQFLSIFFYFLCIIMLIMDYGIIMNR